MYQNELIIVFAKGLNEAIVSLMTHTMESLTMHLFLCPNSFPMPRPPTQRENKLISFWCYKMSPTGSCNDHSPELVKAQQKLLTKHQGLKPLTKKKKRVTISLSPASFRILLESQTTTRLLPGMQGSLLENVTASLVLIFLLFPK